MNTAFNERVLFEYIDDPKETKSDFIGMTLSDTLRIKIIHWGTNRDGSEYGNEKYVPNMTAYIRRDSQGLPLKGGVRWLIDRGHILGLD